MSRTTKSPLAMAKVAYEVGKKALPRYAHKFSRRDFTCAQLFAILVMRKFTKNDYRGIISYLADWKELRETLDLDEKLPHFTTPQKASAKLLDDSYLRKLLTQTIDVFYRRAEIDDDDVAWCMRIDLGAADSTGFESRHCSKYYTKRRKQGKNKGDPPTEAVVYRRWPKLGVVVDCDSHLILSTQCGIGPRPDVDELRPLTEAMATNVMFEKMLLDAGYDSEANHVRLREELGIESLIPAKIGRPTDKLPTGKWRWLMATDFDDETYGQRWQVETVMFMLKARQGESLTARSDVSRSHEMGLMAVAHNVMILYVS